MMKPPGFWETCCTGRRIIWTSKPRVYLPHSEDSPKKVKPLYRLTEREIAAYAVLHHIDYIVEECPMAKGSKLLAYKHALNQLEADSPGTKHGFYLTFLDRQAKQQEALGKIAERDRQRLRPCTICGHPTSTDVCSYCQMMAKAKVHAS